ncbi:MAG: glycosyltransferase family 9 protein [Chloroflexota bacterium]
MRQGCWAEARNILLVRLDNMGDVILLSPAVRTLAESLPGARLTLLASPAGSQAAPLVPRIDETIVWRAVWQDVGHKMPLDPDREMELVKMLRDRRFDAAVIFTSFSQTPYGPAYVCYLAGIPLRLGDSKEFGGSLLTNEVRDMPDEIQQAERNLRLLESVGFEVKSRHLELQIPASAREAARGILTSRGIETDEPYIVIHPWASCQARRYPLARFVEVARELFNRTGLPILFTGSSKEAPAIETEIASCPGRVQSLAGETAVEEFAALLERAKLIFCNNTIPLHLGDAFGVPMVVTYSGTDLVSQWAPRYAPAKILRKDTPCTPCYLFDCPYNQECLDLAPLEVVAAAEEMLSDSHR